MIITVRWLQQCSTAFVGLLLLAGCYASSATSGAAIAPSQPPALTATSAPIATVPIAIASLESVELQIHDVSPKTLLVGSDGAISLTQGNKIEREKVAAPALADLQRAIKENDFFALQEKYPGTKCCDFIAHTIIVIAQGKRHTVYCYNQCPAAFDKLKDAILHLWPHEINYQGGA